MLPTSPPPTPPDLHLPFPYRSSLGFMDLSEKEAFTFLGLDLLRDLKTGKFMFAILLSLSVGYRASLTSPRHFLCAPWAAKKVAISLSLACASIVTHPQHPHAPRCLCVCHSMELSSKVSQDPKLSISFSFFSVLMSLNQWWFQLRDENNLFRHDERNSEIYRILKKWALSTVLGSL